MRRILFAMANVYQLFRMGHYISDGGIHLTVCDLADDGEHRHPHHTHSNTAGRWSRSTHPNKRLLAHEYMDVESTMRPNAYHWKPEDFLALCLGRMGGHKTHFDWDRRCTLSAPSTSLASNCYRQVPFGRSPRCSQYQIRSRCFARVQLLILAVCGGPT